QIRVVLLATDGLDQRLPDRLIRISVIGARSHREGAFASVVGLNHHVVGHGNEAAIDCCADTLDHNVSLVALSHPYALFLMIAIPWRSSTDSMSVNLSGP